MKEITTADIVRLAQAVRPADGWGTYQRVSDGAVETKIAVNMAGDDWEVFSPLYRDSDAIATLVWMCSRMNENADFREFFFKLNTKKGFAVSAYDVREAIVYTAIGMAP